MRNIKIKCNFKNRDDLDKFCDDFAAIPSELTGIGQKYMVTKGDGFDCTVTCRAPDQDMEAAAIYQDWMWIESSTGLSSLDRFSLEAVVEGDDDLASKEKLVSAVSLLVHLKHQRKQLSAEQQAVHELPESRLKADPNAKASLKKIDSLTLSIAGIKADLEKLTEELFKKPEKKEKTSLWGNIGKIFSFSSHSIASKPAFKQEEVAAEKMVDSVVDQISSAVNEASSAVESGGKPILAVAAEERQTLKKNLSENVAGLKARLQQTTSGDTRVPTHSAAREVRGIVLHVNESFNLTDLAQNESFRGHFFFKNKEVIHIDMGGGVHQSNIKNAVQGRRVGDMIERLRHDQYGEEQHAESYVLQARQQDIDVLISATADPNLFKGENITQQFKRAQTTADGASDVTTLGNK